jgi:predicted O-methyltransferase YrrM
MSLAFDVSNLRSEREIDLAQVFGDPSSAAAWSFADAGLAELAIPDGAGGVNPGDRRAIFYLVHHLRARSVLEVGTHVGASTISIASALLFVTAAGDGPIELDTVDVVDVNDAASRPWIGHGSPRSPREMTELLGLGDRVRFIVEPAASYLGRCKRVYDLIFLDGDHAEHAVYSEIALALELLREGGVILLHDYFPDGQPLWSNGVVGPGPYFAVRRAQEEGAAVKALPLGSLPWPTKLGSCVTSLAMLVREDR